MISDRPERICIDQNNLPHCEDGPSIRWRDGWTLWHINGVVVDEQIVMRPETQTVEQIHAEENEEVRRIRIERFGWARYTAESGATVVDSRRNDIDAQNESLYELRDGTRRLLVVDPSTGRKYALGVPSECSTTTDGQRFISHGLASLTVHRS
jgi:hypothetical protein